MNSPASRWRSPNIPQQAANIFRLLLLTGARRGEVLSAKWADLDLAAGVWVNPGATTKQKTLHRVPLSAPARQLLADLHRGRGRSEYVFPGRLSGHRVELKGNWAAIRKATKLNSLLASRTPRSWRWRE